jgi:PEP-CTERM motif
MRRLCPALMLLLLVASAAHALPLTFDDITADTSCCTTIPTGYGGLDWSGFGVAGAPTNTDSGYENAIVSGAFIAFNEAGDQAIVFTEDGSFDFLGAYLTAAWNDGLNVRVRGRRSGALLYDRTVVVNTDAAQLITFDYLGIDELIFDSFGGVHHDGFLGLGTNFAMDDMTLNAVPEPGTGLLVIGGLLGFAGWRRKRH